MVVAPHAQVRQGVIYMVCNHDGYVGLVQLENGKVDVAAAIRSSGGDGASLLERLQRMINETPLRELELSPVGGSRIMTTPRLRRSRVAGCGRLLAIGDAAGYVEPFTGEGMTWAMKRRGRSAATCVIDNLADLVECWRPVGLPSTAAARESKEDVSLDHIGIGLDPSASCVRQELAARTGIGSSNHSASEFGMNPTTGWFRRSKFGNRPPLVP